MISDQVYQRAVGSRNDTITQLEATIERQDAVIEVARCVVKLQNRLIVTEFIDELSIALAALDARHKGG